MVKLGKGEESTPVDFINKRRAALERYVIKGGYDVLERFINNKLLFK